MPDFTFNRPLPGAVSLDYLDVLAETPTLISLRGGGVILNLFGTGFAFDSRQIPIGGVINGMDLVIDFAGTRAWEISGLRMSILDLAFTMTSSDATFLPWLLNAGDDVMRSVGAGASLPGGEGNDTLTGEAGADTLSGGPGLDRLAGGAGNDVYELEDSDFVLELRDQGIDTIRANFSYTLPANFESLELRGGATAAIGNELDNSILVRPCFDPVLLQGLAGNDSLRSGNPSDTLDGGSGADTMVGGDGNQVFIVDDAGDRLEDDGWLDADEVRATVDFTLPRGLENLVLLGAARSGNGNVGNNTLTGNPLDNLLDAGSGNDTLDGGAGADTLVGGSGDDRFIVDDVDRVVERPEGGFDTVFSASSFDLPPDVEALYLTGTAAIGGRGNEAPNTLVGNDAANNLAGSAGNDTLYGQDGNDSLDGGAGNDWLMADGGADSLSGGPGADTLEGGDGPDTYYLGEAADIVREQPSSGLDVVYTPLAYDVSRLTGIEILVATGDADIDLVSDQALDFEVVTGNAGNNHLEFVGAVELHGGAGNDFLAGGAVLDGGTGADTMIGNWAHNVFYVDDPGDVIFDRVEEDGDDADYLYASISVAVPDFIAATWLTGDAAIDATQSGKGRLTGNSAPNHLSGAGELAGEGGNDTLSGGRVMRGGAGDDTYLPGDNLYRITEAAGEGTDTVIAGRSFSLGSNLENLLLRAGTEGIGNALANFLGGNAQANVLKGLEGPDTLEGLQGNDSLHGGAGNDLLDGDAGVDTAFYSGTRADYKITQSAGRVTVSGAEGIDVLVGVDRISFGGDVVVLNSHFATGQVQVSGSVDVGSVLTGAATDLQDIDGVGAITYQWFRDGTAIEDALGSSYTLEAADSGATIALRARFVDGLGNTESLWSSPSDTVRGLLLASPAPLGFAPVDASSQLDPLGLTLTVTFNQPVVRGTGSVILRTEDGTVVQRMDASQLEVSGDKLMISPGFLPAGFAYRLEIDYAAVLAGNRPNAANTEFNFETGWHEVSGSPDGDRLTGSPADDHLRGLDGDDTLSASGGSDHLEGGPGTDTAAMGMPLGGVRSYGLHWETWHLTEEDGGVYDTDLQTLRAVTSMGTISLLDVERVAFTDAYFALDSHPGEKMWQAAALLWAGLGHRPSVADLSMWTHEADGTDNMSALAAAMLDHYVPGIAPIDLVGHLWIVGHGTPADPSWIASTAARVTSTAEYFASIANDSITAGRMVGFTGSIQPLDPSYFT